MQMDRPVVSSVGSHVRPLPPTATCCLMENGDKCVRPASTHNFSKRMEKMAIQKRLNIHPDKNVKHSSICTLHRKILGPVQGTKTFRKSKAESGDEQEIGQSSPVNGKGNRIKLEMLSAATLRRYKKYFKVQTATGLNKQQLADALMDHLKTVPVNEKEILTYFIFTVKTDRNTLDQKTN